jgi:gliding motility associated protien GldN
VEKNDHQRNRFQTKINQPFYYPVNPLEDWKNFITVIYDAIKEGKLTVYKVEDKVDEMINPFQSLVEFDSLNATRTGKLIYDENGNGSEEIISFQERMVDITRLRIKEDWYFDKHLSQFLVRIIALCPIIVEESGITQVCWIPYEPSRKILSEAFVYNTRNSSERRSYDEILLKRIFDSYIIKEENVFDRYVNEYAFNIDALYESERIKNELFDYEQSLWEY